MCDESSEGVPFWKATFRASAEAAEAHRIKDRLETPGAVGWIKQVGQKATTPEIGDKSKL